MYIQSRKIYRVKIQVKEQREENTVVCTQHGKRTYSTSFFLPPHVCVDKQDAFGKFAL